MVALKHILVASLAAFAIASPTPEHGDQGDHASMAQYGKPSGTHGGEGHPSGKPSGEDHPGGAWSSQGKPGTKQAREEGGKSKSWKKAGNPFPEHHHQARANGLSHYGDADDRLSTGSKSEHGGEHRPYGTHQARSEKVGKEDNDVKHHGEHSGTSHHVQDTDATHPAGTGAEASGKPASGGEHYGDHRSHEARDFTEYSDYPPELIRLRQMALGNWTDTNEAEHQAHLSKRTDPPRRGIFECKFSNWEKPCKWTPWPVGQCYKR
jgi:hypothetical protein